VHFKDVNCYLDVEIQQEGIMGIFGDIMSKIFDSPQRRKTTAARTAAPRRQPQASPARQAL
jgi:hypothetical protein